MTHSTARPFARGAALTQGLRFGSLSLSKRKLQDQCAVAGGFGSQLGSKEDWGENVHEKQKGIEMLHLCLSLFWKGYSGLVV